MWKKGKSTKLFSMTSIRNTKIFTETSAPLSISSESWMPRWHDSSEKEKAKRWDGCITTFIQPFPLTIQTTSVTGFQYLIRGEKVIIRPPYCRYILNISVSTWCCMSVLSHILCKPFGSHSIHLVGPAEDSKHFEDVSAEKECKWCSLCVLSKTTEK